MRAYGAEKTPPPPPASPFLQPAPAPQDNQGESREQRCAGQPVQEPQQLQDPAALILLELGGEKLHGGVFTNSEGVTAEVQPCQRVQLASMGFSGDAVDAAMAISGGNMEAAVEWLLKPSNCHELEIAGADVVSLLAIEVG
jgi:hypothetical protein